MIYFGFYFNVKDAVPPSPVTERRGGKAELGAGLGFVVFVWLTRPVLSGSREEQQAFMVGAGRLEGGSRNQRDAWKISRTNTSSVCSS